MIAALAAWPVALSPQTDEAWDGIPYARGLLDDHACIRAPGVCTVNTSDTYVLSNALGYPRIPSGRTRPMVCGGCYHGTYMVPHLIERYAARSVVEIGVCTGATVVSSLRLHGDSIDSYTAVDAWGSKTCNPGCGCYRQLKPVAARFPSVRLIRGYSVPASAQVADSSFDLVFIDAAHDYTNVHADIFAYWPKVKPGGVLAGHDFSHHRNWAGVLERRQAYSKAAKRSPPAYGVGQALAEVFSHCELHVRYGVWWIERRLCPSGPIATENRTEPLWQRPGKTSSTIA
tara:strand:+ start:47 stop:907 length:861 start_codon:yes stop_codon:yes gene_type:complete